jgi:uncharacterized DUF497 family protein
VRITYDPVKSQKNEQDRGLPFATAKQFDWDTAWVEPDLRHPYPEPRFVAKGLVEGRLHVLCFTPIPDGFRVISFRKANAKEQQRYAKETQKTTH